MSLSLPSSLRQRRYTIKTGLLALVLVCILPAVLVTVALGFESYRLREEAIQRETLLRARGLMALVDRELVKVQAGLEVLASSKRLEDGDMETFDRRLRGAPRSPIVLNYILVDREGRQLLNTALPYGATLPTPASWLQLRRIFESAQPEVSNLFAGRLSREPSIALGVPVFHEGVVAYSLNAGLSSYRLSKLLEDQSLPDGWIVAIIDSNGTIVARSKDAIRFVGQKATAAFDQATSDNEEGLLETTNKEGTEVLAAYSRSSLAQLRIAVAAPRATLTDALFESLMLLVTGSVAVFGVATLFAFGLARSMTRAVGGLIEPALALGMGRPARHVPTPLVEVEAVGGALEEASRMLAQATHQAHHDALTGLCNRVVFDQLVSHQLSTARRHHRKLAILAIDLDRFKEVNDRYGHAAGDLVLKIAADRIGNAIRASDVVSRRGGDEFTVLLGDVDTAMAQHVAGKVVDALSRPYPDMPLPVTASVGMAMYPESGNTTDELLERADRALYRAKQAGKARYTSDTRVLS